MRTFGEMDQRQSIPDFFHIDQRLKREFEVIYRKSFVELNPQTNIVIPTDLISLVSSQYIDNFGKTRFLRVRGNWIMTSPLCVLGDIPVYNDTPTRTEFSLRDSMDFFRSMGLIVTGIHEDSGMLTEIKANFIIKDVNIDLYMPIKRVEIPKEFELVDRYLYEQFQTYKIKPDTGASPQNMKVLDRFRYNKKMSKCLLGNMYHLYSKFLSSNSLTDKPLIISNIEKFIDLHITLNQKHNYPLYPPIDIKPGNGIMVKDKIILNSEELAKRLVYSLRLKLERDLDLIKKYKFIEKVVDYYQNVEDFSKRSNQIIVKGGEIIKNWYLININNFRIYRHIQPEIFTYFIRDKKLTGTDKLYIANTRDNLEDGFMEFYRLTQQPEFELIVNKNGKWIRYRIKGNTTSEKIEVVGYYTAEGEKKFVFLLPY